MNIFKALAVQDIETATKAIPLIDVEPALRGEPGAVEAVALDVRRACESVGFFYLAGHGVPRTVIDDAFAASREFHATPIELKRSLKINENNIGYLAVNESMQRHSTVPKHRTTTSSSVRVPTPTTRSSRCSRARRCRAWRFACPAASGWRHRSSPAPSW